MLKFLRINFNSIPVKITLYMIGVLITTAILILLITNQHYKNQITRYHEDILNRKEKSVILSIDYALDDYDGIITPENIGEILKNKILEISDINKLNIIIYNLQGKEILSTQVNSDIKEIPENILDSINIKKYYTQNSINKKEGISKFATYSFITDVTGLENLAIIKLPYETNDLFFQNDLFFLLGNYGIAFLFVLLLGTVIIYVVTKNTFNKLSSFAEKIKETEVISNNLPIHYDKNDEIKVLVNAYNEMLIKLKEQSETLAYIERQETWREFARQVAHEIKNPLTPMKLMIQSYMRKFSTEDEELKERTTKTSEILMQQIDSIQRIADAFSDFAKMPNRKDESFDFIDVIRNALSIFNTQSINLFTDNDTLISTFDKLYLNRIIINIVKNSIQSIPKDRKGKIDVTVEKLGDNIIIKIEDNGLGISETQLKDIFKPRFSTRSSGSGFGLAMVKKIVDDYDGSIIIESTENIGTKCVIKLPYINTNG